MLGDFSGIGGSRARCASNLGRKERYLWQQPVLLWKPIGPRCFCSAHSTSVPVLSGSCCGPARPRPTRCSRPSSRSWTTSWPPTTAAALSSPLRGARRWRRWGWTGWPIRSARPAGGADTSCGRVVAECQEIVAMRPKATTDFDQGYVTPETSVLRLALMAQHGDLVGKDLLLLGDDDLTGIAAALSGLPRRICVLDVDERIVQFVRDVARDRGWQNVQAEVYDVREELPAHLRGQFDTFFTDPVETLKGIFLFLSRCTQALRGPGAAGYFGLSYLEASWQKWRQVQQGLLEMGYAITEMRGAWQDYLLEEIVARGYPVAKMAPVPVEEPDVAFYTSTVYRLELAEAPKPIYTGR